MPKLIDNTMLKQKIGGGNFTFSGARIENLGATEYTLVTIAVDETGTVSGFEKELRDCLVSAVESCKRSPRSDNLLLRVITFSSRYPMGVKEIHGFKPLADIDTTQYPNLNPGGGTPLCDACYSSVGAMNAYGKQLMADDFGANAIAFFITDGDENSSVATVKMLRDELEVAVSGEMVESMISVLIGVNAQYYKAKLDSFKNDAGITQYIDAGDATKAKLAKLAQFISQSVSSQSQALGTGGPSQNISATI